MEQASNFFNPSPREADSTEETPAEPKTSTFISTTNNEIYTDDDYDLKIEPFDAIVVDAEDIQLPVRSNVDPDQPLRPKPPSDGVFKVTPSPYHKPYGRFGVQNPNFYSEELLSPSTTENYGPNDFIVETVKLDKDFFHQFFTSKPLLLGTDVVTSTSVKVNRDPYPRKRSRKTNAELPDSLIEPSSREAVKYPQMPKNSILQQMAFNHFNKGQDSFQLSSPKPSGTSPATVMTSTARSSTPSTTTRSPTTTSSKISDVPKVINSVKTFTRYYIPPEVKISHTISAE